MAILLNLVKVVPHNTLVQRHLVGVFGDDVQLSEPVAVNELRLVDLRAVPGVPVAIHVRHRLPIRRVSQ